MMKSYRVMGIVLVASLVCLAGIAHADTIDRITNGDFATDTSGWTTYGAAYGWVDGTEANHSPDGASMWIQSGWMVGNSTTPLVSLIEGQDYVFSFRAALVWDTTGGGTTQADIEYRSLHADLQVSGGSFVEINQELPVANTPEDWQKYSVTFTATSADVGKTYNPEFLASLGAWTGHTSGMGSCVFGIDSVRLDPVPEPSSLVLLAAGLFGLLAYAWRKRK